jgi:cytidine deaminase
MKFDKIVEHAVDQANKSLMMHKHGAIIISKSGEIVGRGCNHEKKIFCHSWSCHAEVAALLSMGPLIRCIPGDLSMIVVRVSCGELKLSKPCDKCTMQLKKFGISKIFYST